MADDALLERIDAHLARQLTLSDIMRMDHAEQKAWMREGREGMREMTEWIRQMAEETRQWAANTRELAETIRAQRREFVEESRAQREALFKLIDRFDDGSAGAGA